MLTVARLTPPISLRGPPMLLRLLSSSTYRLGSLAPFCHRIPRCHQKKRSSAPPDTPSSRIATSIEPKFNKTPERHTTHSPSLKPLLQPAQQHPEPKINVWLEGRHGAFASPLMTFGCPLGILQSTEARPTPNLIITVLGKWCYGYEENCVLQHCVVVRAKDGTISSIATKRRTKPLVPEEQLNPGDYVLDNTNTGGILSTLSLISSLISRQC